MKARLCCLFALLMLWLKPSGAAAADSLLWSGIRQVAALMQQDRTAEALDRIGRLMPQADSTGNPAARMSLLAMQGMCLEKHEQPDAALGCYERAADLCSQGQWMERSVRAGHEEWLQLCVSALIQKALIHKRKGQRQAAVATAQQMADYAMTSRNPETRARAILALSDLLMLSADRKRTEQLLTQAYQDAKATGRKDQLLMAATQLLAIGVNKQLIGQDLKAESLLQAAPTAAVGSAADTIHAPARPAPSTAVVGSAADTIHSPAHPVAPETDTIAYDGISRSLLAIAALITAILFVLYMLWQRRAKQRQAARSFLEGKEEERQRLARELHDGVSNQLLAVEMKLNSEGDREKALQLLSESREQVRRVSHELMPPEFSKASLDEVVAHYVDEINQSTDSELTCSVSGEEAHWHTLSEAQALEVYRIVQEAVANALRHAAATTIAVGLHREEHLLTLIVSDNGKADSSARKPKGIGVRTMQQRADSIGATLEMHSGSYGHTVRLTLHT